MAQWNYEIVGLALLAMTAMLPLTAPIGFAGRLARRWKTPKRRRCSVHFVLACVFTAMLYGAVLLDGWYIEPNWPEVTRLEMRGPLREPLRILHLSDLHLERTRQGREDWLLRQVAALSPDLILITGDIHQLDNHELGNVRGVLSALRAPLGVFACVGYDNAGLLTSAAPDLAVLMNEGRIIRRGNDSIGLCGLLPMRGRESAYDAVAGSGFRVVMNHTPGLADEAVARGAHLYLCGHTHGGQVRLPFWGAIITNSPTGKRYEAGAVRVGKSVINTSRGLGLEPPPAPQVRFLCRPEITLITVLPEEHMREGS